MTNGREDLDTGGAGPEDGATGTRRPPTHPGRVLTEDFLGPMGITVHTLAKAIKLPRSRINDIVLGRRAVTAETALRLARYLGTTPEFWRDIQARYDLEVLKDPSRKRTATEAEPDGV